MLTDANMDTSAVERHFSSQLGHLVLNSHQHVLHYNQ